MYIYIYAINNNSILIYLSTYQTTLASYSVATQLLCLARSVDGARFIHLLSATFSVAHHDSPCLPLKRKTWHTKLQDLRDRVKWQRNDKVNQREIQRSWILPSTQYIQTNGNVVLICRHHRGVDTQAGIWEPTSHHGGATSIPNHPSLFLHSVHLSATMSISNNRALVITG